MLFLREKLEFGNNFIWLLLQFEVRRGDSLHGVSWWKEDKLCVHR